MPNYGRETWDAGQNAVRGDDATGGYYRSVITGDTPAKPEASGAVGGRAYQPMSRAGTPMTSMTQDWTRLKALMAEYAKGVASGRWATPGQVSTDQGYDPIRERMQSVSGLAQAVTPSFGTDWDVAGARQDVSQGKYGAAAGKAGWGMLGAAGDIVDPGLGHAITAAGVIPAVARARDPRLWHPVSDVKLSRPLDEMSAVRTPTGELQQRSVLQPEDLLGRRLIAGQSDRTMAGHTLSQINEVPLDRPVDLVGGPDYTRSRAASGPDKSVWASAPSAITQMQKLAKQYEGQKPTFVPFTMAHQGSDFANMTAEALAAQSGLIEKVPRAERRAFDRTMREGYGVDWRGDPSWPGIDNPDKVHAALTGPGAGPLRKGFVTTMGKGRFQEAGFPDVGAARFATTEPALLDTPTGQGGYALAEIAPRATATPAIQHPAYPSQIAGQYLGGLEKPVPLPVLFPDFIAGRRAAGKAEGKDYRAFQMGGATQMADQRWLENIKRFYEGRR